MADVEHHPNTPPQSSSRPPALSSATLSPLDEGDAPQIRDDHFQPISTAIDGALVLEKGVCVGTRLDTQPCDKPAFARNLCMSCYRRALRNGEIGRTTLSKDDIIKKFTEMARTSSNGASDGVTIRAFSKAIGVGLSGTRRWLVQLETRGIAVMRLDDNDDRPRWHLSTAITLRPQAEPRPPKPPRPMPKIPGSRGGSRSRKRRDDVRETLRGMAAGWPKGW
jgi:hypothetical protein